MSSNDNTEATDISTKLDNSSDASSNDGETEGENKGEVSVSKEFQENVIKFVKIDDLMRKKQKEVTELRSQRKPCEEYVLSYLDQIGETVIEINTGKLRKNKSETKVPLNQDIIKKAMGAHIKDPKVIEEIMKKMDELRPKNTRVNLKRTSHREKKKGGKKKKE